MQKVDTAVDVVIVGAGAAGLMAGVWAGRTYPQQQILLLDGARKLGAKILVSGGGRCNVTHDQVDAAAYAGASRNAIKKVLKRFDVPQTTEFFRDLGVTLKREDTGKLFPTTDSSQTILQALLTAVSRTNVTIQHPYRVETIHKTATGFQVRGAWGSIAAKRVILATGGRSLPKSGSDGHGYQLAQALGHTLREPIFPALVPLTLPNGHFVRTLSGITLPATLTVWASNGKKLVEFTDSTLCTHFGLSGPAVLDISRHFIAAQQDDPGSSLSINWLPALSATELDTALQALARKSVLNYLRLHLPERLATALCHEAGVPLEMEGSQLTRSARRALVQQISQCPLPISGNRGYNYAEVTAGGVPLHELDLKTMQSRICPGLFCCGEICDVDGRIGGYNFQWAWASGYTAGVSVGQPNT
ncbi:MAG: NAD(P)/FAD-dependent oxidoreductase [Chloroflexota bacterium]